MLFIFAFSEYSYRIQQGSFDDFVIDNKTGSISISRNLDYDKRENYRIEVVASDLGKIHFISFRCMTYNTILTLWM